MRNLETLNKKYEGILEIHGKAVEERYEQDDAIATLNAINNYYSNVGAVYDELAQGFYDLDENNLKEEYDDECMDPTEIIERIKKDIDLFSAFIDCLYDEVRNEIGAFHDNFLYDDFDDEKFREYQADKRDKFDKLIEELENL